jgi:integrase
VSCAAWTNAIRPLELLLSSEDPEARKVADAYLSVPESYRKLLPLEAYCKAACVSPWRVLERASGIKPFRWHDCRHTFASRLRQAGVPLGSIAELLGHKGLAMTKRYAHLSISNLHEAVSRIANNTTVAPEPVVETAQVAYVH